MSAFACNRFQHLNEVRGIEGIEIKLKIDLNLRMEMLSVSRSTLCFLLLLLDRYISQQSRRLYIIFPHASHSLNEHPLK